MPRFLTLGELTERVGLDELTQIAGVGSFNDVDGRSIDAAKVEDAIAFSEELLLAHARTRYATLDTMVPDAAPDLIKGLISDIARYRLRARSGGQGQVSEEVRTRYEDALAFLKLVASGKAELPIAGEPINGESSGRVLAAHQPSRLGHMLNGYRP